MPKKIASELRARAVRLVTEHQQEFPSRTVAAAAVAKQLVSGGSRCVAGGPRRVDTAGVMD